MDDTASLQQAIYDRSPRSLAAMVAYRVNASADKKAFIYPDENEVWREMTWGEAGEIAYAVAAALIGRGLAFEERVAIASTTRLEWILADFAISVAALATTTVYPNTAAEEVDFILTDSGAKLVFAENDKQVAKVTAHSSLDEQIPTIVTFTGQGDGGRVITWDDFVAEGRAYLKEHPTCVDDAIALTNHDTLSTLIYTSGTTGRPKGVRLHHGAWTYLAEAINRLELSTVDDVQFLWLPLSHVFGKSLIAFQLRFNFITAVDGRIDRIVDNLGVIKPNFMCGAPRIFEKVRAAALTGATSKGLKGKISRWAFSVGYKAVPYRLEGTAMPKTLAAQNALADKLVFSKLRAKMGGNIRFMISGSAKLSPQVQRWFYAAGITVIEGYGLTETSAVSFVNHYNDPVFGSLGPATPGLERKIAEDGEICMRGPTIMRSYHNDPEATAEVIDAEGWFHTGDIGHLDERGMLWITDRKKDLLKTSGGKYVAPQKVEGSIMANVPYVSQAVIVGDGHKYIAALLVLDRTALMLWGSRHGHPEATYEELSQRPEIRRSIDKLMAKANERLERWETVKKYAILDHELTVEGGGVTPNMKIRRAHVIKQHQEIVDSLFDDTDER
ncbi:MAG: long-chain fatty acid--CoA ligase [Propionibacteriaceae bacterium]|jgi:long-chain acyl-CoA synthetase|nr:long-chain fatty acid--CoA ligase [Propionibacteriaceae bacterium]